MTSLTPQFVLLTTGAGALMILVGLGRGLLQARSGSRRCPSCDRLIEGRVCRTCTRSAR
jgi:recombinational DNA repair protein RecR